MNFRCETNHSKKERILQGMEILLKYATPSSPSKFIDALKFILTLFCLKLKLIEINNRERHERAFYDL